MKPMSEPIAGEASTPATDASFQVPATDLPATAPTPGSATAPLAPAGYEVLGEIGQGGMGVVYRARDCTLDRPVALKLLQERFAHDPSASRRFLYEAQVTGQLQHPGIPPVHQLGTLSDGRPFLAMKLIQGRTLDALLREEGPGAARWLGVFEAICQALAYAHSQGVIHRDLKPANVMVGAFGEVQVMDWGLAKVLASRGRTSGEPDSTDPDATRPPQPGQTPVDLTAAGSVLGTPAYMPPEQAIGAVDRLDRRSDVFGLGAILCVLLTGKPPFVAADAEATRQLAARARLDDALLRLDGCGAEPELITLARTCLSAEQDDRPADAGVLAAAVARLRHQAEERARLAEMERARAVVQAAEQRKRRRLLLAAFGVVSTVLLGGVVGTTLGLLGADRARREEARQKEQAERAQREEARQKEQAEEARDLARQRYQLALETFHQMVFAIQNRLETRPGTQELRKELLENARTGLRRLVREAERQGSSDLTLVWSHLRMGDVELVLGSTPAARREYQAGHDLAQRLAQAHPKNPHAQRVLSASFDKLGDVTLRLGQMKEARGFYQKNLEVSQRLAQADPKDAMAQRDLGVSFVKLGDVTLKLGQTKEALAYYQRDLEVSQRLAQADPKDAQTQRDLSVSFNRLGNVTLHMGQTKEALDFYQRALEIRQRLAQADPMNALAQRDLSVSFEKLGEVTQQMGQTKEALDFYQRSLEVRERLAQADPMNALAQTDLFVSYWKLGSVEKAQYDYAKASAWFARGRAVLLPWHQKKLLVGQFQNAVALVDREMALCRTAENALASLDFVLAQQPDQVTALLDVRVRALLKLDRLADATTTAEHWADWAEKQPKERNEQGYNAACALALCAAASEKKHREALTAKAVAVLTRLRERGYFKDAARLAHFQRDTDFSGVREQPVFADFARTLKPK
jgi:tetratricopeptide (TPR) repeat protein